MPTAACDRYLTVSREPQPSDISRCPHGPVVTKYNCPAPYFYLPRYVGTCLSLSPVRLTSGHYDVGVHHRRLDVVFEGRLHERVVLFDDADHLTVTLHDVTLESSRQPDVGVSVDEYLHVHQLNSTAQILVLHGMLYLSHQRLYIKG